MRLRIHQIKLKLDYEKADVLSALARLLNCHGSELENLELLRRSLDARAKGRPPRFVLSVEVDYTGDAKPELKPGRVELAKAPEPAASIKPSFSPKQQPVVVGAGPAGLLAAYTLAKAGWKPLLIERGVDVRIRSQQVETFWQEGVLDPESNVLYGEGGAGLFSDGKLTSRSKDRASIRTLFELLVDCGASSDILIDAEPHLGSDALARVIPELRSRILRFGGEIRYGAKLEAVSIEDGVLRGIRVSGQSIDAEHCFLATGHSARDVYTLLAEAGVPLAAKPFAVGVRAEMPQSRLNVAQYGVDWATHPKLGPASFRLTRRPSDSSRGCYTFCTCPGGLVMSCASSEGMLTTNGMSYSKRAKPFGNAAFLVPVGVEDYPIGLQRPELAGVILQETLERAAFSAGGEDFGLPAQTLEDFLADRASRGLPDARSCQRAIAANLGAILPEAVATTLRETLPRMLRELNGIRREDVLLYGIETRSSSPVRVPRDPGTRQSPGARGLFPIGEGSGYTGGIVSSALDGMAAAHAALTTS